MSDSAPAPGDLPPTDFTFDATLAAFTDGHQAYLTNNPDAQGTLIATGSLVFDLGEPTRPRILLIQRAAGDSMPGLWEIPGGGVDDEDRSILHAVARELYEETGLRAHRITAPIGEPQCFGTKSGKQIRKFNFVVQVKPDPEGRFDVKLDPKEHQRYVWANEAEVESEKSGDLKLEFTTTDLKTIVLQAFDQLKPVSKDTGS